MEQNKEKKIIFNRKLRKQCFSHGMIIKFQMCYFFYLLLINLFISEMLFIQTLLNIDSIEAAEFILLIFYSILILCV